MFNLATIEKQFRKGVRWHILIIALSLSFMPTSAQTEVIVYQPVNGLFVRGTNVNQFEEESGTVDVDDGTWSVFQTPLLSASPRPLWSPNGQEIAFRFVGKYAGIVNFFDGTIEFTTESIEGALNVPFDVTYIRGWSADGDSLTIDYGGAGIDMPSYLTNIDLENNTSHQIRLWYTDEQVTDMPLPPDATSVQLNGGYRIERNPVFDDWLVMQFDGSGYYSTFDIGEPVNADINVLWNFRTNQYISLDALVPGFSISVSPSDWSHDGTRLLLQARSKDLREPYILTFHFTPDQGVTLVERAVVDNRTVQHWFDAGDLFFSLVQGYQDGAAYVLGEVVNGEYRETPFFTLNGDQFMFESSGDWFMAADEAERHRLSCLFEWSLPTRLNIGDSVRVIADDGVGLSLRTTPDEFSEQIGLLEESNVLRVVGGTACSGGYRWWQVQLADNTAGWAAEADTTQYFLEPVTTSQPVRLTITVPPTDGTILATRTLAAGSGGH